MRVRREEGLHTADAAVFEHHLDAVGMRRAAREDAHHDALGLRAGTLVLFLDYPHPQAGMDFASVR